MENDLPKVTKDFLNKSNFPKRKKKRGGPYNKKDRLTRRKEVFRLYFEYGYSALKISDMLEINRNTIYDDIRFWYSKTIEGTLTFHPEYAIMTYLQRLDIQRSRLREQIDNTESFKEKISMEHLIFGIDSKILYTHHRLSESKIRMQDNTTQSMNRWLKANNKKTRFVSFYDKVSFTEKAFEKIKKIAGEDGLEQIIHDGQPII